MPTVIAHVRPRQGHLDELFDAFGQTVPLVHKEPGCELFAVHTDGSSVFLVERWTTNEDFQSHVNGPVVSRFRELAVPSGVLIPCGEW